MIRGWIQIAALSLGLAASPGFLSAQMKDSAMAEPSRVTYHTAQVDGVKIFYREAGPKDAPTVVLLHGFPSSSHMFRELIPRLSDKYHVLAPDYPGFGYSDAPSPGQYAYTFDHLADTVDHFLDQKGITKYSIYIQDYGSPIGFRLATRHPERIQAIITQNTRDYEAAFDCSDSFLRPSAGDWRAQPRITSEASEGIDPEFHGATGMFPRGRTVGKCHRVEQTPLLPGLIKLPEPARDFAGAVQRRSRFECGLDHIL